MRLLNKKYNLFILRCLFLLCLTFSCVDMPESEQTVRFSFDLTQSCGDLLSKVTLDGNDEDGRYLKWTGDETMTLIFGKTGTGGKDNRLNPSISSVSPGCFAGEVNIPTGYSPDDLRGFVIPGNVTSYFKWKSGSESRISMLVPDEQVQKKAGIPEFSYSPFFCDLSGVSPDNDGKYSFSGTGLTVKTAADMIRFNIYGCHTSQKSGEVLKSVSITSSDNTIAGTAEWVLGSTSEVYVNNASGYSPVVKLEEEVTIADKTVDDGIEVYMSVMGKNTKTISQIVVVTDRAKYTKVLNKKIDKKTVDKFVVYNVNVDLSSGFTREVFRDGMFQHRGLKMETSTGTDRYPSFTYTGYAPLSNKPVDVFYYIPAKGDVMKMPVLFSLTGAERVGNTQLDAWRYIADTYGFAVINPQFQSTWYNENAYQFGAVVGTSDAGILNDRETWTYNIIESLFDYWCRETESDETGYRIFGHSAGGQFVGRMMMVMPDARVISAVAANPSSWAWPVMDGTIMDSEKIYGWPYSIHGTPSENPSVLKKVLSHKLFIAVGTDDNGTESLDMSEAASKQGGRRYDRAVNFYKACADVAEELKCSTSFSFAEVEGVGHSTVHMVYGYYKPTANKTDEKYLGENSAFKLLFRK